MEMDGGDAMATENGFGNGHRKKQNYGNGYRCICVHAQMATEMAIGAEMTTEKLQRMATG